MYAFWIYTSQLIGEQIYSQMYVPFLYAIFNMALISLLIIKKIRFIHNIECIWTLRKYLFLIVGFSTDFLKKISLHYFLPNVSIDLMVKKKWYGVTTAPVSR